MNVGSLNLEGGDRTDSDGASLFAPLETRAAASSLQQDQSGAFKALSSALSSPLQQGQQLARSVSSNASLMSTSMMYMSVLNGAMGAAPPPTRIAMPTDGDIFSLEQNVSQLAVDNHQKQLHMQHLAQLPQLQQNGGGQSFVTFAELPPGAIVYMAAPPPLSHTSETVGPHTRTPMEESGGWMGSHSLSYAPQHTTAAPLTSSTHSNIFLQHSTSLISPTPLQQMQAPPPPPMLPPQPPQQQQAEVHINFEENYNVLSEDKKAMLSIPRDVIEPTVGSSKYLQQGSSACYTFRFQLCRGYQQGRCVHRHQCAFIHSRHVNNPLLAGQVTHTQVHRNTPVSHIQLAPYARHPEGMTLQVYDAVQSKNVMVESSHIYCTHGSLAGYRAALMDSTGQVTSEQGGSPIIAPAQQAAQPADAATLSSSVRLQFCLHFDKSLCARGETCNFVHRVELLTSTQAEGLMLSSPPLAPTNGVHGPFSDSTPRPMERSTTSMPQHATPSPFHLNLYPPTHPSSLTSSTVSGRYPAQTVPLQYFPVQSSVPPMHSLMPSSAEQQQMLARLSTTQSWPASSSTPQGYALPMYLHPHAGANGLLQGNTNYF